jgi:hypothetical protein
MFFTAVVFATVVPITLGLLLVRRGQRRIGCLLVAHGLSVGLLLGGSEFTSTTTAALVADQLLAGGWVFLFLWLVLIAYVLPDGRPLSIRWLLWVRVEPPRDVRRADSLEGSLSWHVPRSTRPSCVSARCGW